jgi:anti-sigma regulatory factor (Ser/Thr protein kinase)
MSAAARFQDQGRGFDPGAVPDPLAPENLCMSCGRGILFMRSLMDEVRFQRAADGGTQVNPVETAGPRGRRSQDGAGRRLMPGEGR